MEKIKALCLPLHYRWRDYYANVLPFDGAPSVRFQNTAIRKRKRYPSKIPFSTILQYYQLQFEYVIVTTFLPPLSKVCVILVG